MTMKNKPNKPTSSNSLMMLNSPSAHHAVANNAPSTKTIASASSLAGPRVFLEIQSERAAASMTTKMA